MRPQPPALHALCGAGHLLVAACHHQVPFEEGICRPEHGCVGVGGCVPVPFCRNTACPTVPPCLSAHADSDVVFTVKPVWQSYLAYLEAGSADAAFQAEYSSGDDQGVLLVPRLTCLVPCGKRCLRPHASPFNKKQKPSSVGCAPCPAVNGGNYVVLPTPAAIKLFEAWSAKALKSIKAGQHDQQGLDQLMEHSLRRCTWSSKSCRRLRREVRCTRSCHAPDLYVLSC